MKMTTEVSIRLSGYVWAIVGHSPNGDEIFATSHSAIQLVELCNKNGWRVTNPQNLLPEFANQLKV